jgi:hypothetical protein
MMSIYTGVGGHDVLIRQRWEYWDCGFFFFLIAFFLSGKHLSRESFRGLDSARHGSCFFFSLY